VREAIEELKTKCEKLSFNVNEKSKTNQNDLVIINVLKRKINKLENELFRLNNKLDSRRKDSSISINKSTFNNSFGNMHNSLNNTINQQILGKSNSCLNVFNFVNQINNSKKNISSRNHWKQPYIKRTIF
jgi:formylmethanofuran dehydrogenase subunit E-like metal-binding protein